MEWEKWSCCLMDTKFHICKIKSSGDLLRNDMHMVNTTEL